MEKVSHPAGGSIIAINGVCEIEICDCRINFFLYAAVFSFIIERTMLENNVFGFGNIYQEHLRWHFAVIIGGKSNAVTFGARNTITERLAMRVVDIGHYLAAAAVSLTATLVIQFALDTVEQTAYSITVLSRYIFLLLPKIPIAIALIVF